MVCCNKCQSLRLEASANLAYICMYGLWHMLRVCLAMCAGCSTKDSKQSQYQHLTILHDTMETLQPTAAASSAQPLSSASPVGQELQLQL
jgi:hypothetical protein